MNPLLRTVATIFRKELRDALRDRRTLLTVLFSSVLGAAWCSAHPA